MASRHLPQIVAADPRIPRPDTTNAPCSRANVAEQHGPDATPRQAAMARKRCRRCPAARGCLLWALANPDLVPDGTWGGTTPEWRDAKRAQLADRLGDDWVSVVAAAEARRNQQTTAASLIVAA